MNVLMAVLYQEGQWDEIVVDVPNICTCMTYDEINSKARKHFYAFGSLPEHKNCFGAYVTNERYDDKHLCTCQQKKDERIWDILAMVNEHFGDEMSDLLDEDFDALLLELAE